MPINKETSTRLVRFGYHFESIPREVVQQITDPTALAYYIYLLTLPDDWIVRAKHLQEHFGVGRDKHYATMKVLRELGVVWHQEERDDGGKIVDRKLMVGAIPVDDLPDPTPDLPKLGKTHTSVQPDSGKSAPLHIDTVITDRHISSSKGKPILEDVESYCRERNNGIDPEQFFDFYESKGWKVGNQPMKDWKAAVRTWEKRNKSNANTQRNTESNKNTRRLSAVDRVREARERARVRQQRDDVGIVVDID